MFPYPLGVLTLLQGLYSMVWIVLLMDVLSPTFDLREASEWSLSQALLLFSALLMTTFAVGVAMHTLSRNLFRTMKDAWDVRVVTSPGIRQRLGGLAACRPSRGPSLDEVHAAEGPERMIKAGEFMHALEFELLLRAPHVHDSIQVYRDQYRLARAFILPSLMLAVVVPFWEPLPSGHLGDFPLISLQIFFLGVFFAGVCMYAFRERTYRYALARLRVFWTVQGETPQAFADVTTQLAAVK
jgi:hypothetical protein